MQKARAKLFNNIVFVAMLLVAIFVLAPILIVFMNSFKGRFFIADAPFAFPNGETFVGLTNYVNGIAKTGLPSAFLTSLFITVLSVLAIVLFTSMTAWFIVRVKNKATSLMYYLFVFSMIVPFQMVMFPMSKITNMLGLGNPLGIVVVYLGFGAGLSVFMFTGFVKSIPLEIEEAATIDGCNPLQTYFRIVLPILKPTAITVAILNAMWVWNDYLLPTLVLDSGWRTIPMAVQYLMGGHGSIDMGAMMSMLVLSIIPIVIFYLACQKYIIRGVIAGAVKG